MKVQNIDLSSLSSDQEKGSQGLVEKLPNWVKFLLAGLIFLLIGLLVISMTSTQIEKMKPKQPGFPSPTPEVTSVPTVDEKTKIEEIREKWNKAKHDLDENNYNNELLLPPQVELNLQLEK